MTNILLGPVYPPVLLAKSAASLDQLSGGRFTLGIAPGGRADDYTATGADFHTRGRALDSALELMHAVWRGEPVGGSDHPGGPTPLNGERVPVMIGGTSEHAIRRAATWGVGWTMGGGPAEMAAPLIDKVHAAWSNAGRDDEPRIAVLAYYSLGADAERESRDYLRHYYGFLGGFAEQIADGALRSEAAIAGAVSGFADVGVTELYFDATTADLDQIDRLADVVSTVGAR
jgi:alkanesulfonate monooxygenase SsuD/methylene tetrahydromethanopterin reductase-like flavin-dependent oxidoreductase (luciferase family)